MNAPRVDSETAQGTARRLDVQGLRAIAVFVVVAFHAGLNVPGGFTGVDIFFVISGFVITAMLAREWRSTGTLRFRTFYARRFRRLTPALAVLVLVVVVISALIQSPLGAQQITAETGIGALLLAANIVIANNTGGYFDAPAAANPLLNTWSLSVEEQFYLIFPLLLFIGWKLMKRLRTRQTPVISIVVLVGVVSFLMAVLQAGGYRIPLIPSWLVGFYGPVTRVWEFAAGALLALMIAGGMRALRATTALILAVAGVAGILASLWLIDPATAWPGPMTLLPVVSTFALLAAGTSANAVSRLLGTRPFVAVGDISYSWYLWHWPLIVFALLLFPQTPGIAVIAAVASLLPALLSYRFVEQPIRNLRKVSRARMVRIVSFTLVPPMVISLLLIVAADNGFWNQRIRDFTAAATPMHVANAAGCNESRAFDAPKAAECLWNESASGTTIYLVGDSHADHLSEAVIAAGEATGHPVRIATANACPFFDVYLKSTAKRQWPCRSFVQGTLDYLDQQPPGIVIVTSSSSYWNSRVFSAGLTPDSLSRDPKIKHAALEVGLESSLSRLQKAGHQVVLVQDVPYFGAPLSADPQQFSAIRIATDDDLAVTMSRKIADKAQAPARNAFTAVADRLGVTLLDLRDFFCAEGICTTQLGDDYLYRDDGHISIAASNALASTFSRALATLPASANK